MTMPLWQSDELEAVPCPLCRRLADEAVISRPDGLVVVRCGTCDLQFLSPRPVAKSIVRLYDASYFRQEGTPRVGYAGYMETANRRWLETNSIRRLNLLARHMSLSGKGLLEIGCATGEFSREAARRGMQVLGIDLNADAIAIARQRHPGLAFQEGPIGLLPAQGGFDVICSYETIEHVLDPLAFLKEVCSRLRPGGFAVFSTANADHAQVVGPSAWTGHLTSMEHLYFFGQASLAQTAAAAGLVTVAAYTARTCLLPSRPQRWSWRQALKAALKAIPLALWLRNQVVRRLGLIGMSAGGQGHELVMVFRRPD
jgi:2-polyprenyl-3-methyl-5-hydroxy-6-metoxy-1,4-benzoquinol methylase